MSLIDNYKANILNFQFLIVQPVIKSFNHSHKTHIIFLIRQFLNLGINDLIKDPKFRKHLGCLFTKFDAMR